MARKQCKADKRAGAAARTLQLSAGLRRRQLSERNGIMLPPRTRRHWTCLFLAASALGGSYPPEPAYAQDEGGLGDEDSHIGPAHVITPTDTRIFGLHGFTDDSKSVVVGQRMKAVNIWAVIVYYWPEIAAVVIAGSALISLSRTVTRKRIRGKPHCRKCNYCLEGSPSGRCPECGHEHAARRPIMGRPMWRRVLPATAMLAVVMIGSVVLWIVGPPRVGVVSAWANWWSRDLLVWARAQGWTDIVDQATVVYRVAEIDVATGERGRTIIIWPDNGLRLLRLLPDHRAIFIRPWRPPELALVDLRRAEVMHTLSCWEYDPGVAKRPLVGVSEDHSLAYAVRPLGLDESRHWIGDDNPTEIEIVAWNLNTGDVTPLFRTHTDAFGWRERFYLAPGPGQRVLQLPREPSRGGSPETILLRDLDDDGDIPQTLLSPPGSLRRPVFSADGQRVYMLSKNVPGGVWGWSLQTGARLPTFTGAPQGYLPQEGPAYDWQRERMYLTCHTPSSTWDRWDDESISNHMILVGDVRQCRWIARLEYSDTVMPAFGHRLMLSPDGRTLAAAVLRHGANPRGIVGNRLLLWNLSVLDELEASRAGGTRPDPETWHLRNR